MKKFMWSSPRQRIFLEERRLVFCAMCGVGVIAALIAGGGSLVQGAEASAATSTQPERPGVAAPTQAITPAHVYQRVDFLRREIELIRLEMGIPKASPPPIEIEGAEPREVYFQALTIFRKSDRLAFEHTRERVEEPVEPRGSIQPAGVREVVNAALGRIGAVKESLAITEQSEMSPLERGIDPSQVLNSILGANRELNQLLDRPFAPSDVYRQLTVAIAHAARLLDSPSAVSTPPPPPPFERRKRPSDVYRRMVECFHEIREIGKKSGVPMLTFKVNDQQIEDVAPSDVYDIASLLVSELAHLHRQLPGAAPSRKVYNPGRKLPSHVYQRMGILCSQMEALQRKVDADPDWLKD
jgi:hypothetical protein